MDSDRLRTVQLDVCSHKQVEKAVETVRSSLKDPEKGGSTVGQQGEGGAPSEMPPSLISCQKCSLLFKSFPLHRRRTWIK